MDKKNFGFKCSKIVKNASYLQNARALSRTNAKEHITVDIYILLSNQSARKVLSTCLANTKHGYTNRKRVPNRLTSWWMEFCLYILYFVELKLIVFFSLVG